MSVSIDEEVLYWLLRLADIANSNEEDYSTVPRQIRLALYLYLKHKLPNHFKMDQNYFIHSNQRTGKIYKNERW